MNIQDQMIEYMVRDIVSIIVEKQGMECDEAMNIFYNSAVFDKLQNKKTALYLESPLYVYILFVEETYVEHKK